MFDDTNYNEARLWSGDRPWFCSLSPQVRADDNHLKIAAPEDHAPIMVMGDHMHKAGEYMFHSGTWICRWKVI